jgi:short-subunit dehydrogenase
VEQVVLVGRRGSKGSGAEREVRELEEMGVRVKVEEADVEKREEVKRRLWPGSGVASVLKWRA